MSARAFDRVIQTFKDLQALDAASSLMNWDQQVLMPPKGLAARSQHLLSLTKMHHELLTSDEMQADIEAAQSEASEIESAQLRVLKKDVEKAVKMPLSLVERKAKTSSEAYANWRRCKAEANFAPMVPFYTELFDIARETAEILGYEDHIYDALIDQYEEGSTYREAVGVFEQLKQPSIDLIKEINSNGRQVDDSYLIRDWDQLKLRSLMERVVSQIGFSLDNGRLDIAANAFCSNLGGSDIRMTTRPSEHLRGIVSSSLHEMGHGLYEQNQRADWANSPLSGGVSLAVHESQSRTWENVIGRSYEFWSYFYPWFSEEFRFLQSVPVEEFYRAYSKVEPSFIRVGSDEVSYNLHILIRFELEVEIITKQLAIKDLPEAWNSKYQEYLGITPPNDALGCLQDVHWSRGSVGYFPTYTFGNLIGVQIWEKLKSEVPGVDASIAEGNFRPILEWLVEKVYGYGRMMPPKYLLEHVVGESMNSGPWLKYAENKFRGIYQL
jgi:carboxypeptidase Taq